MAKKTNIKKPLVSLSKIVTVETYTPNYAPRHPKVVIIGSGAVWSGILGKVQYKQVRKMKTPTSKGRIESERLLICYSRRYHGACEICIKKERLNNWVFVTEYNEERGYSDKQSKKQLKSIGPRAIKNILEALPQRARSLLEKALEK